MRKKTAPNIIITTVPNKKNINVNAEISNIYIRALQRQMDSCNLTSKQKREVVDKLIEYYKE